MFFRYRRLVPKEHRDLVRRQRLSRPNWYVGSAEGRAFRADVRITPDMQRQIDEIAANMAAYRERKAEGTVE